MRIAVIHSYYRSDVPSGESSAVDASVRVLAEHGHDVLLISRRTDVERKKPLYGLRSAVRVMTGFGASPDRALEDFEPDIVHVHNLVPNFGTNWIERWQDRLLYTAHNFRTVCANGLLYRDGHNCFDCTSKSSWAAIHHRCYQGQRLASIPVAFATRGGVARSPLATKSRKVITLSHVAKGLFENWGVPTSRLAVVPNGVDDTIHRARPRSNGRWLVAGRISQEKGVLELVRSWPSGFALDVIGTGPQASELSALERPEVALLGSRTRERLRESIPDYEGLVFPSTCLEMQPTIVLEAMAAGVPIVALSGNAASGLVEQYKCGASYSDAVSLEIALARIADSRRTAGSRGRQAFEQYFTQDAWWQQMEGLYADVLDGGSRTSGGKDCPI